MITKICEVCGKEFKVKPSLFKRRFCSRACYEKWWIEKKPYLKRENNPEYVKKRNEVARLMHTFLTTDSINKMRKRLKELAKDPNWRIRCGLHNVGRTPWNKGKCLDEEYRRKISEGTKKAMKSPIIREKCKKGVLTLLENSWLGFTEIEKKMYEAMLQRGLIVKRQFRLYEQGKLIGVVDFALPERKVIVECYGDFWHANPKIYSEGRLTDSQKKVLQKDAEKREWARKHGWKFLYFYETEIKANPSKCVDELLEELEGESIVV